MSQYPEHDKLKDLNGENQIIGDFLEWLSENNLFIAKWCEGDQVVIDHRGTKDFIADYFGINRAKLEAEKCQMLDAMRAAQ